MFYSKYKKYYLLKNSLPYCTVGVNKNKKFLSAKIDLKIYNLLVSLTFYLASLYYCIVYIKCVFYTLYCTKVSWYFKEVPVCLTKVGEW